MKSGVDLSKSGLKLGDFYGMELPRVGAFTDFGGSRYRNPVHFLGYFSNFTLISEFSGLVYYTGGFPGVTLEFGLGY